MIPLPVAIIFGGVAMFVFVMIACFIVASRESRREEQEAAREAASVRSLHELREDAP